MAYEGIDFTPPQGVREEAARGLAWRREYGRGGTAVGVARARDLSNGTEISPQTARRMKAYFDRHEIDKQGEGWSPSQDGYPSAGRIAWALWGGDPGRSWAEKLVRQMNAEDDNRSMTMEIERRSVLVDDAPEAELVIETRATGREAIRGLAIPYNRLSVDLGGFRERILPGAFDKILARQRGKQEIVSYFNHDANWLLGRESAGTLEVISEDRGISYIVEPPDTQAGRDVLALVRSRNLRGSSFAFTVSSKGGERYTNDETGKAIREVVEASGLYEMGPVVTPAYSSTSVAVAMRSYHAWLAEQQPQVVMPSVAGSIARAWAAVLRMRHV